MSRIYFALVSRVPIEVKNIFTLMPAYDNLHLFFQIVKSNELFFSVWLLFLHCSKFPNQNAVLK